MGEDPNENTLAQSRRGARERTMLVARRADLLIIRWCCNDVGRMEDEEFSAKARAGAQRTSKVKEEPAGLEEEVAAEEAGDAGNDKRAAERPEEQGERMRYH